MQYYTVSNDRSIYEAWPDVALCDSGRLVCCFSECTTHGNRDLARITLVTSDDRGRTWSGKRYLSDRGKKDAYYNCARISKLRDGTLTLVCDFIIGSENGRNVAVYLWTSSDEGESWEGPILTPAVGIVPEHITELESGRLLLAAHTPDLTTGKLTQYLWYTDDRGATWSERVTVGSDLRYNLCEASLLPLGGNELVCFMRENSGMGYDCLKSFSHDGGATWDGVYNTPMPGAHRPTSGFIHSTNPLLDGCILVTYRYMQGGGVCRLKDGSTRSFGSTQSVHGAIMRPESVKATERFRQNARIFQIAYDRAPTPDLGYTGWVQFDDGEIYLVNYIRDLEDKAWIQGISFTPEELMA